MFVTCRERFLEYVPTYKYIFYICYLLIHLRLTKLCYPTACKRSGTKFRFVRTLHVQICTCISYKAELCTQNNDNFFVLRTKLRFVKPLRCALQSGALHGMLCVYGMRRRRKAKHPLSPSYKASLCKGIRLWNASLCFAYKALLPHAKLRFAKNVPL